jgi:Protein of unknown function (DUF3800)
MFTAYFDASGHPDDQKVMTVAGFVSSVKKWKRFEGEWDALLRAACVKYFRMSEFVSDQGEFDVGWKGQSEKRRLFIDGLAKCLKRNVNKSFRMTLVLSDYAKINNLYMLEENIGKPYTLCCVWCSAQLRKWAKTKKAERKLLYYFEDGDKDKGNFEHFHEREFGELPLFLPKNKSVAFQPADFAAWKVRTNIQEALKDSYGLNEAAKVVRSIAMLAGIPSAAGVADAEHLESHCKHFGFPRRTNGASTK